MLIAFVKIDLCIIIIYNNIMSKSPNSSLNNII
jgi:hypothetical protein